MTRKFNFAAFKRNNTRKVHLCGRLMLAYNVPTRESPTVAIKPDYFDEKVSK